MRKVSGIGEGKMSKRRSMTGYVETVIQMSLFPRPTVSGDELMLILSG